MAGGVSSFAYQGTNCHAILAAACRVPLVRPQSWVWHRTRLWFQATSHPLLQQAHLEAPPAAVGSLQVQCSLRQPALAYLMDHSVHGRAAAPSSLLLEVAAAAGQLLCSAEQAHNPVAVTGAAFQQPLLLAAPSQGIVGCSIQPVSGTVRLGSATHTPGAAAAVSATAQLQSLEPSSAAAQEQQQSSATAAAAACSHTAGTPNNALRAAAALLGSNSSSGPSSSAAFAAILTDQQRHTGYWIHPAVADASLHLAAALRAQAEGSFTAPLVSTAVGVYTPLRPLAGHVAYAAANAYAGGHVSSHWLSDGRAQLMAMVDHIAEAAAAVQSLAAAMAAASTTPVTASMQPLAVPASLAAASAATAFASSLTAIQAQLSEVVASVLGRSDVPHDQPLMEAGLDSIGARAAALEM